MAKNYLLWMGIVLMTKKGYSMVEMLVCLCIVSALLMVSIRKTGILSVEHYSYLNNYLLIQSKAILNKEYIPYEKGVTFNSMGHVNQARTIDFKNHKVIIHLGNGYITYE